jgi:hypothetical protein
MSKRNAVNVFTSFAMLADMYPSYAMKSNETIPFITIDGFEAMAAGVRNVSKASFLQFKALLPTPEDVAKWNNYSVQNKHWIAEGRKFQVYDDEDEVSDEFPPYVYWADTNDDPPVPVNGSGPFIANWQMSPVPPSVSRVNFDVNFRPSNKASLAYVQATGKPSITEPSDKLRKIYKFEVDGPISPINVPVFDKVAGSADRKVASFLSGFLAWKYFFDNVLPKGQQDVLVVVQSCAKTNTFRINGAEAAFEGEGDLHHPKYKHMVKTENFIDTDDEDLTSDVKVQCNHIVHVYPTPELEDKYKTTTPVHYALIIVAIFSFAGIVFLLYDYFVTNRQNRTERQADKSNAIVQEMFPGDMATRVFDSVQPNKSGAETTTLGMSGFGRVDRTTIAELHPEATVLCKLRILCCLEIPSTLDCLFLQSIHHPHRSC